jgi:hypothetical protein
VYIREKYSKVLKKSILRLSLWFFLPTKIINSFLWLI